MSVINLSPYIHSTFYAASGNWVAKTVSVAADRYTLLSPVDGSVKIGSGFYYWPSQQTLDLSAEATWDTVTGTDYRTAANRRGVDFCVYACVPTSGTTPTFKVSANSTVPTGYDADTSRKVGGFHGMCGRVGTISGHPFSGYVAGDIVHTSVWDLKHRPAGIARGHTRSIGGWAGN